MTTITTPKPTILPSGWKVTHYQNACGTFYAVTHEATGIQAVQGRASAEAAQQDYDARYGCRPEVSIVVYGADMEDEYAAMTSLVTLLHGLRPEKHAISNLVKMLGFNPVSNDNRIDVCQEFRRLATITGEWR